MKAAIVTVLFVVLAFAAGVSVTATTLFSIGMMQKPERVVETKWIFPPTTTTTFGGYTPMTPEEQERLDKAIAQIDLPTTTTLPRPSTTRPPTTASPTTVPTAPPTTAPAPIVSTTTSEPITTTEPTTTTTVVTP